MEDPKSIPECKLTVFPRPLSSLERVAAASGSVELQRRQREYDDFCRRLKELLNNSEVEFELEQD